VRVLVTGSSGFIGKALRAVLEHRDHVVVPYDYPQDVRDRRGVEAALDGVDAVINLAGVLGTEEIFGAEHYAAQVNILGALNVYDAAAARDIPVVQIGTGHKGQPNPYAITKACAEDLGLARAGVGGERIVVVRAFHAYGPGQKACAPHGRGTVRKIVPSMVCRALTGMPVQVNGSGEQAIDLVHVDDVAAALADALHAPAATVVEAGTGKPTSVLDAARAIIEACGSDSPIEHLPMRRGEPANTAVVAEAPVCPNPWPYQLDATVGYYRDMLR
jgi:UDP-glucose 4-epimerase